MNNAERWDVDQARIPETKIQSAYAEEKEKGFPRKGEVADLGGGQGADAEYFMRQGHNVTLVDFSEAALAKAQDKARKAGLENRLKPIKLVLGEESLPMPDQSLDVAYSRLALHFFNKEKTIEILKGLKLKLKPGGRAYITVKSPEDGQEMAFLKQTAQEIEAGVYNDKGQIKSRFTKEQWEELLKEAGIQNYSVIAYTEDLSGRGDVTKSGNTSLLLIEIEFTV